MKMVCFYEPLELLGFLQEAKSYNRSVGPVFVSPLKEMMCMTTFLEDVFIFLVHPDKEKIKEVTTNLNNHCINVLTGFCIESKESSSIIAGIYDQIKGGFDLSNSLTRRNT